MADHSFEAENDGKSRFMKHEYKAVMLTGNEQDSAVLTMVAGTPTALAFSTKRPDAFPVGVKFRFRNKFVYYGWTILTHEAVECRTKVVCGCAHELYRHWRPACAASCAAGNSLVRRHATA